MYQEYKDIAEFRLVYISEAHAIDDKRPVPYAIEKNISEHTTYGERCTVAARLLTDEKLTIPAIIDKMDNNIAETYDAHPNRAYVITKDGLIGARGPNPGPTGWKPGLKAIKAWLVEYKATGKESIFP
jgi:hypothetical protein